MSELSGTYSEVKAIFINRFVFIANLLHRVAKHSTKHYFNFDKLFFSYN